MLSSQHCRNGRAGTSSHKLASGNPVESNVDAASGKLASELVLPTASGVDPDVDEPGDVGWLFDAGGEKHGHALATQAAKEEAELKDHVLSSPAAVVAARSLRQRRRE